MDSDQPEPWLRGPLPGVSPHLQPVFHSFAQVKEELFHHIAGVPAELLWRPIVGRHSLGFHLKHIAGSVDRLVTYLFGQQLSPAQIDYLRHEHIADVSLADLLIQVNQTLDAALHRLREINASDLKQARAVGKKALPTTALGLLVHICEHTQRHLGQAILIAHILRPS